MVTLILQYVIISDVPSIDYPQIDDTHFQR
jgi:hypothetical protein